MILIIIIVLIVIIKSIILFPYRLHIQILFRIGSMSFLISVFQGNMKYFSVDVEKSPYWKIFVIFARYFLCSLIYQQDLCLAIRMLEGNNFTIFWDNKW